jgi:hypothetical protein
MGPCNKCRFWKKHPNPNEQSKVCMRNPPSTIMIPVPRQGITGPGGPQMDMRLIAVNPPTMPDNECGEFAAMIEAVK